MSAWGVTALENTTALNWVTDVYESTDPVRDIVHALRVVQESQEVDCEDAEVAFVAATIVATAKDSQTQTVYSESISAHWNDVHGIVRRCGKSLLHHREMALRVLGKLKTEDNGVLLDWENDMRDEEYIAEVARIEGILQ